jgi:hypothetical protein
MLEVSPVLTNQIKQDGEIIEDTCRKIDAVCDLDSNAKGKFISVFVPDGFTVNTTLVPNARVEEISKLDATINSSIITLNSSDTMDKIDALKPARGIVYGIIIGIIFWIIFMCILASLY